jgi:hypothetical protein
MNYQAKQALRYDAMERLNLGVAEAEDIRIVSQVKHEENHKWQHELVALFIMLAFIVEIGLGMWVWGGK